MCNLNAYSSEKLKERHLTDLLQLTALHIPEDRDEQCEVVVESVPQANIAIPYEELIVEARHHVEDFVVDCMFAGKPCGDITQVFEPVISNLRMCYMHFQPWKSKPTRTVQSYR